MILLELKNPIFICRKRGVCVNDATVAADFEKDVLSACQKRSHSAKYGMTTAFFSLSDAVFSASAVVLQCVVLQSFFFSLRL